MHSSVVPHVRRLAAEVCDAEDPISNLLLISR